MASEAYTSKGSAQSDSLMNTIRNATGTPRLAMAQRARLNASEQSVRMSERTRRYGTNAEAAVNRRTERLMNQYASWQNPLQATDWNLRNADRITRAAQRMLRRR